MKVIPRKDRFVITDDKGKIIDDAQGWGYKTKEKAQKAMWYRFNGGKQKVNKQEQNKKEFFAQHKEINEFLYEVWTNNFKEIARGEITEQDIVDEVGKEFGVVLPIDYVGGVDK